MMGAVVPSCPLPPLLPSGDFLAGQGQLRTGWSGFLLFGERFPTRGLDLSLAEGVQLKSHTPTPRAVQDGCGGAQNN